MLSFEELHRKTLPEYKKNFIKIDFVSYYLWRPICDFLTILLLNTSVTATSVTLASFYSCLIALVCFAFVPGLKGALLGYLFIWFWNIADGIDGNIARYTDTCSKSGDLWDAVGGYAAMVVFYLGAGIVAASEASIVPMPFIGSDSFMLMGAIASLCTIFPRLATQKKQAVYGSAAAKSMKDRTTFSLVKIIALNLVSINGLAGLLFLIAIVLRLVNIFMIVYFFIMLAFAIASTYSVMRGLEK